MPLLLKQPLLDFISEVQRDPSQLTNMTFLGEEYHSKFRLTLDQTFLMKNYLNVLPISAIIIYAAVIFVLPKFLPKDGFKGGFMKTIMFLWNVFLSALSLAMLVGTAIPYYNMLKEYNYDMSELICERRGIMQPDQGLPHIVWAYVFALSKYLELVDTLFLVLKHPTRPIPFLHWFHHMTVLCFTWYAVYTQYAVGYCFIIMNSFIHTFMYFYYALTDLGFRPSWAKLLTIGQITQMVLGIVCNVIFAKKYFEGKAAAIEAKAAGLKPENNCLCYAPEEIIYSCVAMYGSYLFLFVRFFVNRYILGNKPAPKTEAKPKTE